MAGVMGTLIIQIACYSALMIFTILGMAFMLRGFFWKYIKVRTSFGKNVLVKVRTPLRDYYAVGWVEENFLCYKFKDFTIRISISTEDKIFYRSLAVTWVDVDEETNSVCKTNYSAVSGFDAKKHSDLLTRALMRPTISSNQDKIILVCCIITIILAGVSAYLAFKGYAQGLAIYANLPSIIANSINAKGTVITASSLA